MFEKVVKMAEKAYILFILTYSSSQNILSSLLAANKRTQNITNLSLKLS